MKVGLGIDTGGTYTDGVIYDFDTSQVVAAVKSLTTKEDLSIGITNVLENLPLQWIEKVKLVSLSTTLATNACVEGKGSRAGLLLLGYDEKLLKRLGRQYGLEGNDIIHVLAGSHGQRGEVLEEPDWEAFKQILSNMEKQVDAIGIAEYWGLRNPEYEITAKELVRTCTRLPVVCAHELSGEINSLRRASTTLLNARLIPLIDGLIQSVRKSLTEKGIKAPLMIVRGDGSLMTERFAREKPVETLLSGPAASVVGGMRLSGKEDCIVVDIGGTTTDLAVVRNGKTHQVEDGVDVGGWRTGTRAIQVQTTGLGGDSLITFDHNEYITLGPRKAAPLCWLASRWPDVILELQRIQESEEWHTLSLSEFFYQIRPVEKGLQLGVEEQAIITALSQGPLSIEKLSRAVNSRPYFLKTEHLEFLGLIGKSGLTPTDLMHIDGTFSEWNTTAAALGANILSSRLHMTVEELAQKVFRIAGERLYTLISTFLLERNWGHTAGDWKGTDQKLLMMGYEQRDGEISFMPTVSLPLVGIGAPTHAFLPEIARKLGTECIIPENAGVANAVGAITGSILAEEIIVIKPQHESWGVDGYHCHSTRQRHRVETYSEAIAWSQIEARELVEQKLADMGADQSEIFVDRQEDKARAKGEKSQEFLLETRVVAHGMGKIKM